MATTTNYGWTTPDDTSLVKDGASAIRTLGTSVDTTTKNLNPETTLGDISFRSSTSNVNTRVAIGSSGQNLTVVAGAPSWAASATSVLTTTGDTLYASAANTLQRLGIGSTGQVLTVASGVPSWATSSAGGMTLLSTTTLAGASTTVTVSSTGYNRLQIDITGVTNATSNGEFYFKPNNQTDQGFYTGVKNVFNTKTMINYRGDSLYLTAGNNILRTDATNRWTVILDYPADSYHPIQIYGKFSNDGSNNEEMNLAGTTMNNAITSLVFVNTGGDFSTGTVKVYGVK